MGKKNRKRRRQNDKKKRIRKPFVSICTPTFNRRPFIPSAIQCYLHQDYPRDKLEWIIIDDGTDPIEDLVTDISGVRYFKYEEKMPLGKKRNLMHKKSKGDIIVYMDDDDYYPPCRVSHSVDMLVRSKRALCAGSSELHIWFNDTQEMVKFGPYGPNHATAGTFAFKRELLEKTGYDETACLAEEKHFLKNYTIPMVQLNPRQTILVFSHDHNTFDKRKLLNTKGTQYVKDSTYTVDDFIKEPDLKDFYVNKIKEQLDNYDLGKPEHKPDVIKQTKEIEEKRKQRTEEMNKNSPIIIEDHNGNKREINNLEAVTMFKNMQAQLFKASSLINSLKSRISDQDKTILELQEELTSLKKLSEEQVEDNENITFVCNETIELDIKHTSDASDASLC